MAAEFDMGFIQAKFTKNNPHSTIFQEGEVKIALTAMLQA